MAWKGRKKTERACRSWSFRPRPHGYDRARADRPRSFRARHPAVRVRRRRIVSRPWSELAERLVQRRLRVLSRRLCFLRQHFCAGRELQLSARYHGLAGLHAFHNHSEITLTLAPLHLAL